MSTVDRRQVAKAFGAALRASRLAAGVTQESLAEHADCDRTLPSLLERGLRTPTLSMLIAIGHALAVEPAQLVAATLKRLQEGEQ